MTRKAALLLICMGWLLQVSAQQEYFIYVEHEKHQPFYVRMGDKTYSSSAVGHIILAHLRDSTYKMSIGFPNNQFPEQEYNIQLNKRDRGFELKNLPEKGWSLFDLTSLELISPVKPAGSNAGGGGGVAFIKRNDDFARLMSGVVNDTAVLYVAAAEKKPAPVVTKKVEADADLAKDSQKADADSGMTGIVKKEAPIEGPKKADEKVDEQIVVKKTENNPAEQKKAEGMIVDSVKKTETVSTDANKKAESASTEISNPVKKTEVVSPDLANTKKSDSVTHDVANNIKKTDSATNDIANNTKKADPPANELSKPADTAKKVNQEPVKEIVFDPPALPVISVVKQYVTDSGYYMLMMDDKDSVNVFIPADAKEEKESKTEKVKKWFKNLVGKKPAEKNEDKSASNSEQGNKTVPAEDKEVKIENKPAITDSSKSVNGDKSVSQNQKVDPDNKVVNPDTKTVNPDSKITNPDTKSANSDKTLEKATDKKLSDQNTLPARENVVVSKPDAAVKSDDDSSRKSSKLVMMNSDCRAVATTNDLDKLRVKLVQEKDAESRIAAAKKVFKTKCFTAAQIKALSELFPYDEQKYEFLEAAYPFVSDTAAFKELVSLLDEPAYVSRFRKLVRLD